MVLDVFRIVGIPLLLYTLYGFHRLIRSHYKKFVDYQVRKPVQPSDRLNPPAKAPETVLSAGFT
jgi:hypothetical protein